MPVDITFYGAAKTVTGSKHMITIDKNLKILLDCGLYQGMSKEYKQWNRDFGFDASDVDIVLLSHAHIDHSGLLPRMAQQGFEGVVYSSAGTNSLCSLMLRDSAHIQESDIKYVNKRRSKKGLPPLKPLYTEKDVLNILGKFQTLNEDKWIKIHDKVEVMFTETSHILGSVAINLRIQSDGEVKTIGFSGDIGRPGDKILRPYVPMPECDYLICESTYGDKLHDKQVDVEQKLLDIVTRTCVENKGKLIIPAFSVDRTQELIYALDRLEHFGKLPFIDVYVDSPLSVKATHIMNSHRELFNQDILEYIVKDGDPFGFPNLHYISDVEDSKKLNEDGKPAIIISASGMATAGRIKHHIKNNIKSNRNTILLVGYASPSSLAGQLRNGNEEVRIFGEHLPVNARIEQMHNFSAHGDYNEMMDFIKHLKPKKIFLVHGEEDSMDSFAEKLNKIGHKKVVKPIMGESFRI